MKDSLIDLLYEQIKETFESGTFYIKNCKIHNSFVDIKVYVNCHNKTFNLSTNDVTWSGCIFSKDILKYFFESLEYNTDLNEKQETKREEAKKYKYFKKN